MSHFPSPTNLRIGFAFDKHGTHTFALGWEIDSPPSRYLVEFSVDQKKYYRVSEEIYRLADPPENRVDITFSAFVRFLQSCRDGRGVLLDIRNYPHVYWRLVAEFRDATGEKILGHSTSNVVAYEMPPLE